MEATLKENHKFLKLFKIEKGIEYRSGTKLPPFNININYSSKPADRKSVV